MRHALPARVRPRLDLLRLVLLLGLLGLAARRAARLTLDVENRAMRSAGTEEARAEERREKLFGKDASLVLLLEPRTGDAGDDEVLDQWVDGLRGLPSATGLIELPGAGDGERLVVLALAADAEGRTSASLDQALLAAERSAPASHRLLVSGPPAGEAAIAQALHEEQREIVPVIGGVLLLLLLAVYRHPAIALGALLPAVGGIALTGALQDLLGLSVDPVTSLLPPVLLAVGVASSVHLIDAYLDQRFAGADPVDATQRAIRAVRVPALGCAATTMAGFLALCLSPVPAVERFGLLAAAGVAFTFCLSFLLLPPWLRLLARSTRLLARAAGHGPWRGLSIRLARALALRSRVTTATLALAALFLGWAWTRLEVDTDPLRILPARHPFRGATEAIGQRLGGTETFDLLLEPPEAGEPRPGLKNLLALQARLLRIPGVCAPVGLPRTASDGTQLLSALLSPAGTTAREATFGAAEQLAHELGWPRAHATGPAVRVARDSGAIARGEIYGLLAAFLALGPGMWVGLRSLRLTLLGLAANTLPCLLLHGGLALAGRPLSVASAMIGSVILGLVVDNAIYFLHGYRQEQRRVSERLAVARTLRHTGRSISVTSLVLALGFLAGLVGELTTTREFGLLACLTILAAWAANLFVLPSLLLLGRRGARRETEPGARPEAP